MRCACCNRPISPSNAVTTRTPRRSIDGTCGWVDERNVHAQLKQCNRYASGNAVGYRVGLIERIGLESVEALESDQEPRKHTIDELKEIKKTYSAKAKALKAMQA